MIHPNPRHSVLQKISGEPLDLLVVGGGIVGSGIARDAAMRGLRVGLVDLHDFAFGSSSRSSRLLHGGLRYLAQGRVGLVHEASVEKKVIRQIAPHLAQPLPFVFPTYRGNREWVLWQLKIGVKIYDLLCGGRNLGASSWLSPDETLRQVPGLRAGRLNGAVRYYDGLTNDARLTIDTLRSASMHGAMLLNYCRFEQASRKRLWECTLRDLLGGNPLRIRTHAIVNATGSWAAGLPHSRVQLRVTKGVHLVVERAALPVPDAVVMSEGNRILFAIPWGERTILGTTDTDYQGSAEQVRVADEDIQYILRAANRFFPEARLEPDDLVSCWAGLRPLIANPNGKPSDISRSHQIRTPEPGWWDVAGGKLTTYRLIAEQTTGQIARWLRREGRRSGALAPCLSAEQLLLPPSETRGLSGITPPPFCRETVDHFCVREWALHLDDVMIRRSSWAHYYRDVDAPAEQVAEWMAKRLDWDSQTIEAELQRYRRHQQRQTAAANTACRAV